MKSNVAIVALTVLLLSPAITAAQDVRSVTVLIDSLSTLPIGTGLTAASDTATSW